MKTILDGNVFAWKLRIRLSSDSYECPRVTLA